MQNYNALSVHNVVCVSLLTSEVEYPYEKLFLEAKGLVTKYGEGWADKIRYLEDYFCETQPHTVADKIHGPSRFSKSKAEKLSKLSHFL